MCFSGDLPLPILHHSLLDDCAASRGYPLPALPWPSVGSARPLTTGNKQCIKIVVVIIKSSCT